MDALAGELPGRAPGPGRRAAPARGTGRGPADRAAWRGGGEPADFFALKGVLEALAAQLGVTLAFEPAPSPSCTPAARRRFSIDGGPEAGWLGEIHPLVCREWDLEAAVGFEVATAAAARRRERSARRPTRTSPPTRPCTRTWPSSSPRRWPRPRVRDAVLEGGGELLRSARVFDLYAGEQVGEGRKSLALRLEFRAGDRTLTDEEVAERRDAIRAALEEIGGIAP